MATYIGDNLYAYKNTDIQTTDPLYRIYTNSDVLTVGNDLYNNQGETAHAIINAITDGTFTVQEFRAINYPDNNHIMVISNNTDGTLSSLTDLCRLEITAVSSTYGSQCYISHADTSKYHRVDLTDNIAYVYVEKNTTYNVRGINRYKKTSLGITSYYVSIANYDVVIGNESTKTLTMNSSDYKKVS